MSKQVPENYFETLRSKIVHAINDIEDEVNMNAPVLASMGKKEIYKIPENYFNQNLKVINYKTISKGASRVRDLFTALTVAASVVVLLGISSVMINKPLESPSFVESEFPDMIEYYLSSNDYISTDVLIALEAESVDEPFIIMDDITDYELENYLESIINEISLNDLAQIENIDYYLN